MIVGHRWEYDIALRWYTCVSLPFGGVESHQWCVGCDVKITDEELCRRKIPLDDKCFLHTVLDILARQRGFEPIEAGTIAEWKLRKKQGVLA